MQTQNPLSSTETTVLRMTNGGLMNAVLVLLDLIAAFDTNNYCTWIGREEAHNQEVP